MARPRTYDKDLRDKLVEETANRLAEGPAENLGLRDLTKSVGTSTNAVYSLFGAKEVLVWEAIRKILGEKRVEIEKRLFTALSKDRSQAGLSLKESVLISLPRMYLTKSVSVQAPSVRAG